MIIIITARREVTVEIMANSVEEEDTLRRPIINCDKCMKIMDDTLTLVTVIINL